MSISFAQLLNVRGAMGATVDAAGSRIYYLSTTSGVPGLWGLRLDQDNAWPEPLAVGPDRVQYAFASPRRDRLVCGLDRGGNERTQLHLLDGPGQPLRPLSRSPDAIHHFGDWHPDGRYICFAANVRNPRYFDVFVQNVESGETRCVLRSDSTNRALGFEPGGRRLLVQRLRTPFEHELLLLDPADGSAVSLTAGTSPARYESAQWSPDGRWIYCATDRDRDLLALASIDPTSGALVRLAEPAWDVEALAVSPGGRALAYSVNQDGCSRVSLRELASARESALPLPAGSLCYDAGRWAPTLAWSKDDAKLVFTLTRATAGQDIWLAELPGGQVRRITRSWDAGVDAEALAEPELVRYPTFDGRQIPAYIFRPTGAVRNGSLPALFYVHGGPESQLRPSFNPVIQYFAQRGFVVVAPNVRGSTGYGKAYSHLDDVERRLDSVRDLAAGAEWLAARGEARPGRIAVMGASYGGYMVLAALTERPDLWAAGVDIVGIANFVTFLERTGPWRRHLREAEYGSLEHHRALLERLSPLHRADRIAAPLLVIHGANDPRVPVSEAEQIVDRLQAKGRPVEYLRFEDEGHGVVKLANRLMAYPRIADFLERHLIG